MQIPYVQLVAAEVQISLARHINQGGKFFILRGHSSQLFLVFLISGKHRNQVSEH